MDVVKMEGIRKDLQSVLHLIYAHAPSLSEETIDLLRNLVNGEFDRICIRSSPNADDIFEVIVRWWIRNSIKR